MLSAQKLKKELALNIELTGLLDVLKGIAASQFRILEKKKERFGKFLDAYAGFFQMIDFSQVHHSFAQREGALGIAMITSDEGFMGGLNARVINTALEYAGAKEAQLIILGKRGAIYLEGMGKKFESFPGIGTDDPYKAALDLKDFIIKESLANKFSRLILVYPKPVTFTVQKVEVLKILPCDELFEKQKLSSENEDILVESSVEKVVEYLVGTWIVAKFLEVFEDSKLAEFSARIVHLEESYQNLLQIGKGIRFQYLRSHHELVDRGTRELFSAQLLRKKKDELSTSNS